MLTQILASACVLAVLILLILDQRSQIAPSTSSRQTQHRLLGGHFHGIFSNEQAKENVLAVRSKRRKYIEVCKSNDTSREDVDATLHDFFTPSLITTSTIESNIGLEPCPFVFLDFGANVGDSLGKFINAGIPNCPEKNINAARIDLQDGMVKPVLHKRVYNKLIKWVNQQFQETSKQILEDVQPEMYCYFGVEGNPVFTDRLKALESRTMRSYPRPVRRAHFFTETVGAAKDGPISLYLDTINKNANFWGSSILADHIDVKKSAQNGEPMAARVEGLTLTTLIKKTLQKQIGGHLIIKMDVEGAEYAILNEAFESNALCDLVDSVIRVDVLVEIHNNVSLFL